MNAVGPGNVIAGNIHVATMADLDDYKFAFMDLIDDSIDAHPAPEEIDANLQIVPSASSCFRNSSYAVPVGVEIVFSAPSS